LQAEKCNIYRIQFGWKNLSNKGEIFKANLVSLPTYNLSPKTCIDDDNFKFNLLEDHKHYQEALQLLQGSLDTQHQCIGEAFYKSIYSTAVEFIQNPYTLLHHGLADRLGYNYSYLIKECAPDCLVVLNDWS